jgi:hypothetical protein
MEHKVNKEETAQAVVHKEEVKQENVAISLDKAILGFLAFSILANIFLVMHVNTLSGQVTVLTDIISKGESNVRASVPTTIVSGVQQQQSPSTTAASGSVKLAVVTDKRCKTCDVQSLIGSLSQLFGPSLDYKVYDYSDAEGKRLLQSSGAKLLPAALFDNGVTSSPGYSQVSRYLSPAGQYLSLAIGAEFDPTAEICDNKVDDNGDGKIDCADPQCVGSPLCRESIPKKLDVFVMSKCPYGIQAINSMKSVLSTLKDIKFDIHYIADEANGVFSSLHGQTEVDEDLRQLCVKKYYADAFMDYVWCRSANIEADWKNCTAKMDSSKILQCSTSDEGKALLRADIKIAQDLKVSASPTFLANNRVSFNAISPEDIKNGMCKENSGMVGCSATLNSTTSTPAGSCATT